LQKPSCGRVIRRVATSRKEDTVAEIQVEHKERNVLPWLLGLALVALVIVGFLLVLADSAASADAGGAREVGNPQEASPQEKKKDETPRRLQYWALVPGAEPALSA
jgi:hypothetical protein